MKHYNIPIFVPHEGCPFDCAFCNQRRITGADTSMTEDMVRKTIKEYLVTLPKEDRVVEVAFFGGSFTGISTEKQTAFLSVAYEFIKSGEIDGIRLSTRPDYISQEILDRLESFGTTAIELGVQSLDSEVLRLSGRGHTADDVKKAVDLIKKYPFKLGLQMMTGLPGDTPEKSIKTAEEIIKLKPDFVRIYPTLVLKDTYLEKMYLRGEYRPQTVDEAVAILKVLLARFYDNNIDVIRVSLAVTDEISPNGSVVAGPFHSAMRELAEGEIYFDKICELIENDKSVRCVSVKFDDISKAVGNGKRNTKRIKEKYGFDIKIKPSKTHKKWEVSAWKE